MRIAMIHWGYPPVIGGVETHLSELCPSLANAGHKVSLLTGSHIDEPRAEYIEKGVHITRRPIMDLNWLYERGLTSLRREIAREVSSFLDSSRAEIIHAHNMHYFSDAHARVLEEEAKRRNIPLILTVHNVWDDVQFLTLTRDIAWDHFIAISNFIRVELQGIGIEHRRITMMHHGIDAAPFVKATREEVLRKYPQLKGRKVVFHPARMGLAKGSAVVVKAFRIIKERVPDSFLVLAGTKNIIDWGRYQQSEIAYVNHLCDVFGLSDDTLVDFFPHNFIPSMYAASDVCVYPSIFPEPFGLVTLEAMAAGKPVVVSRSGGLPEIIKNGVNGTVVPPRDHKALAKAVVHLLRNPKLAHKLGARGRVILKERHTIEEVRNKLLALYRRAIDEKGRGRIKRVRAIWSKKDLRKK